MEAAGSQCMAFAATYLSKRGAHSKAIYAICPSEVQWVFITLPGGAWTSSDSMRQESDRLPVSAPWREKYQGPKSALSNAWPMIDECRSESEKCV